MKRECKDCLHRTIIDNGAEGISWCPKFEMEANQQAEHCLEYEEKEQLA